MTDLTLRKTVIGGETAPDDWQVMWSGLPIGRIIRRSGNPHDTDAWSYFVIFDGLPQVGDMTGTCASFDEAKARFKASWAWVNAGLTDDDIARARDTEAYNAERARNRKP